MVIQAALPGNCNIILLREILLHSHHGVRGRRGGGGRGDRVGGKGSNNGKDGRIHSEVRVM